MQSDFFKDVFEVVRLIPIGKVSTYGAIAKYLGATKSSRMVGYAMNASHAAFPPVPAHRVLNRNGLLTGKMHFAYPEQMQELLEAENIEVVGNQVLHFKTLFWDPSSMLSYESLFLTSNEQD
jgi:methylated-DNA-protein-cysteine methyltransferase-like protein